MRGRSVCGRRPAVILLLLATAACISAAPEVATAQEPCKDTLKRWQEDAAAAQASKAPKGLTWKVPQVPAALQATPPPAAGAAPPAAAAPAAAASPGAASSKMAQMASITPAAQQPAKTSTTPAAAAEQKQPAKQAPAAAAAAVATSHCCKDTCSSGAWLPAKHKGLRIQTGLHTWPNTAADRTRGTCSSAASRDKASRHASSRSSSQRGCLAECAAAPHQASPQLCVGLHSQQ